MTSDPIKLTTIYDLQKHLEDPKPYVFLQSIEVKEYIYNTIRCNFDYLVPDNNIPCFKDVVISCFSDTDHIDVCFQKLAHNFSSKRVQSIYYETLGLVVFELYFRFIPKELTFEKTLFNFNAFDVTVLKSHIDKTYSLSKVLDVEFKYPHARSFPPSRYLTENSNCFYSIEQEEEPKNSPTRYPILYRTTNKTLTGLLLMCDGHLKHCVVDNRKIHLEDPLYSAFRLTTVLCNPNDLNIFNVYKQLVSNDIILSTPINYFAGEKKLFFTSCFIIDMISNREDVMSDPNIVKKMEIISSIQNHQGGIGIFLRLKHGHDKILNWLSTNSEKTKSHHRNRSSTVTINVALDDIYCLDIINMRHSTILKGSNRSLFPAVIIPDEFMMRHRRDPNSMWHFFPIDLTFRDVLNHPRYQEVFDSYSDEIKEIISTFTVIDSLTTLSCDKYSVLYNLYESLLLYKYSIKCSIIMKSITTAALSSGTPFIVFSDTVNHTNISNDKSKINATNLCTEIIQPTVNGTTCCVLASLNIRQMVNEVKTNYPNPTFEMVFDLEKIRSAIRTLVFILNSLIDRGDYAHEDLSISSKKTRPIAIGIQGYYNALVKMKMPYPSSHIMDKLLKYINNVAREASSEYATLHPNINWQYPEPYKNHMIKHDILYNKRNDTSIPVKELRCDNKPYANSFFTAIMPTSISAVINGNIESYEIPRKPCMIQQFTRSDMLINVPEVTDIIMNSSKPSLDMKTFKKSPPYIRFSKDVTFEEQNMLQKVMSRRIDQSVSYNVDLIENKPTYVEKVIIQSWLDGIKTLYYMRFDKELTGLKSHESRESCQSRQSCQSCQS